MGEEKNSAFQIIRRAETETGNSGCAGRNPECLVLDEPTAMLDPSSRKEVINIVKELIKKRE